MSDFLDLPGNERFSGEFIRELTMRKFMERREERERSYGHLFRNGEEYARGAAEQRWVVENFLPEGYLALLGATS
jgi:hypothetical protein